MNIEQKAVDELIATLKDCMGQRLHVTHKQAATILGIDARTLQRMGNNGEIGFLTVGTRRAYTLPILAKFLTTPKNTKETEECLSTNARMRKVRTRRTTMTS